MGTINTHSAPITPQQARPAAQQAPVQQQAPQGQHQTQVGDASQVRSHTTAALNSEPAHHGSDPHAAKETVHRQGEAASHITGGESHGTDKSYGDGHDAGYKKKKTWQYKTVHNAHVAHATADAAELAGVVADGATKAQGGLGTRLNAGLDELAHHNRVGGHHGHGDHGASAADEVANAANSSSGADDVAHAVGGADEAANAANSASGADEIAHGLAGADEAAAVAKGAPKTPTTALKSIENSNLSSDTKDMYQAIRDQATKSTGGADDAAKAVGGADEAATAAKAAGSADEAATAAKAAGSVDEVAHAAGKLSVLGKVAKGAGVLGAVVGTVAGPLQISEGIKEGGLAELRTSSAVSLSPGVV